MVRELDVSKITLRLTEKTDNKGKEEHDDVIAKLTGQTLPTLQQCLYRPTELTLRGNDGSTNKVVVSLKYLPVKMQLDPSESINNMGTLRVDVLDAADLPSADRNGYSDPYCKFVLNGKDVFKTKVQKKTLHPAWNEFFEVPVKSRTAAEFKVNVYDWDFGDKADFLGSSAINLEVLDPFQPQIVDLSLDGKSGTIRLKMLFKPDYVVRSRQGSSTFSGTFAPAGKVIGAPVKGVGMVGGGVVKGANFLRHMGRSKKSRDDSRDEAETVPAPSDMVNGETSPTVTPQDTPSRAVPITVTESTPSTPVTPLHTRSRSFGSTKNGPIGTSGSAEAGTATLNVVSATGYPPSSNIRVYVKIVSGKGVKEIGHTKSVKSGSGQVKWENESFKVNCAADTQFQIQVKDHGMFGSGDDLGEGLFFVDDQGSGGERSVKAGSGTVILKSNFVPNDVASSGRNSPDSKRGSGGMKRSFLSKREPSSRGATPS
jgi:Ca2+-dependent lipid-binding protein